MFCCYIIYSPSLDQYYVGASQEGFTVRLTNHNSRKYSNSFTSKVNDWKKFVILKAETYDHAIRIERHIKRMKSRVYIQNLEKYAEMRAKLIEKTRI